MPETAEAVDVDAELLAWYRAQQHIETIDRQVDNITSPLTPKDRGRLLAERERHARTQAEVRERLVAARS